MACGTSSQSAVMSTTTIFIPPVLLTTTSSSTTTTTTTTLPIPDGVRCVDGMADDFLCDGLDLIAQIDVEALGGVPGRDFVTDLWGWTDERTGSELVIISLARGTSFVDITDPVEPIVVGWLPLPSDAEVVPLQDIKVYADHVFIVGESVDHGMQVVDLKRLVDDGVVEEVARLDTFSGAHNLAVNEATGYGYVMGSEQCLGGLVIVDLSDPADPAQVGCFDGDGYVHDAQCVTYAGPDLDYTNRELCFGSNEDTLTIVDVTDKADPAMVSRIGYDDFAYSHQGWLSQDGRYFFLGDELDEFEFEVNTTTVVFDLTDLDDPVWIGNFVDELPVVNHNLFVVGDLMYQTNYDGGLRVFDVSDPASLDYPLVAFFDSFPAADDVEFDGAFSSYPFFGSGIIAVSDISGGLFLIRWSDG